MPPTLPNIIKGCLQGNRADQRRLFEQFYSYALTVALHYSSNRTEAEEIVNDGFLRAFRKLDTYAGRSPFRYWLRRLVVNAAIDYYRKYHKRALDVVLLTEQEPEGIKNPALDRLELDDALALVQQLPPCYRLVFNLHVIEGFSHAEISKELGISPGTSKSNLAKARLKINDLLGKQTGAYQFSGQAK